MEPQEQKIEKEEKNRKIEKMDEKNEGNIYTYVGGMEGVVTVGSVSGVDSVVGSPIDSDIETSGSSMPGNGGMEGINVAIVELLAGGRLLVRRRQPECRYTR